VRLFVEEWRAAYGSPYLVAADDPVHGGELVEDGAALQMHPAQPPGRARLAFIDGVRRVEASLYTVDDFDGRISRGVAGAHACGAVLVDGETTPTFAHVVAIRHLIFGSGVRGALPSMPGGWAWRASSIADTDPDAPLAELQLRMRRAEGELAELLCADGWFSVVDGPLTYVRSADLPVVGYVKTHHRMLLPPVEHASVPRLLEVATRTSLFAHADRYSAYVRVSTPDYHAGPWSGIARIEIPQSTGLTRAIRTADAVTGLLPRFAGIAHRDPRAPQNLQPVGALERHLRHLLGSPQLAVRAVRDAIAQLSAA
jgi:hypothetical protein